MSDEKTTIQIDVTNPESLARGLQLIVENVNDAGRAVGTLATILGATIAVVDRSRDSSLTLSVALLRALDCADRSGLAGPIVENLRNALLTGCNATPPPKDGARLVVIQGGRNGA